MSILDELTNSITQTTEETTRKVLAETLTNLANDILTFVQKNLGDKPKRGRKKAVDKAEAPVEQKPKRKYTRRKKEEEVDDTVSEDPVKMAGKKRGPKKTKSVYELQNEEENA